MCITLSFEECWVHKLGIVESNERKGVKTVLCFLVVICLAVAGKARGQRKYLPEIWFLRTSLNPLWPYWSILYNLDSGLDCEEVE